ncbi:MAG: (4Fe-4S)-binding protein [Vicinamibacterales bacterium]
MSGPITKRYSRGDLTVIWQPAICAHSGVCARGLPAVFDPRRKPWIVLDGPTNDEIAAQIDRCPSGALTYERVSGPATADQ